LRNGPKGLLPRSGRHAAAALATVLIAVGVIATVGSSPVLVPPVTRFVTFTPHSHVLDDGVIAPLRWMDVVQTTSPLRWMD